MYQADTRFIPNPFLLNWSTTNPSLDQICRVFMKRLVDFTTAIGVPTSIAFSSEPKENFKGFDMF